MLAAAVLIWLASGCGLLGEDPRPGAKPQCTDKSDCPGQQICRAGLCSVSQTDIGRFDFLFTPPDDSTYVTQFVDDVRLDADQSAGFALEPGVTVDGRITYSGSAPLGPEAGTLVFRHRGSPGEVMNLQASVRRGKFNALVFPGRWDLSFVPADPSRNVGRVWTGRDFTSATQLRLNLPRPENLDTIEGSISYRNGLTEAQREWVVGARVFAVSRDGTQTSTVDTTDEKGRYAIGVIPGDKTYDLHVRPVSEDQFYPRAVFEKAFSAHLEAQSTNVSKSLGHFVGQPLRVDFRLKAPKGLEGEVDWAGTEVALEADIGKGVFTRSISVEADGRVELTILPAPYRIRVVPPNNSSLATKDFEFNLRNISGTKTLELERKRQVAGRVVDSEGRNVEDVRLEFSQLDGVGSKRMGGGPTPRPISTTTDETGRFEVWLEKRPYRVVARPPSETGQPVGLFELGADRVTESGEMKLVLPAPVVASGDVLGRGSEEIESVAGTRVKVYRKVGDKHIVVGRAEADEEGHFDVLLPYETK